MKRKRVAAVLAAAVFGISLCACSASSRSAAATAPPVDSAKPAASVKPEVSVSPEASSKVAVFTPTEVSTQPASEVAESSVSEEDGRGDLFTTATLYADFSAGVPDTSDPDLYKTMDVDTTVPITVEDLAAQLSDWSGLDFLLNSANVDGDSVTVEWAADSTLVAGLGDREQKDDFYHFYDAQSLDWFMMDSLAETIKANLPVTTVYYSQNGGQPLDFTGIGGLTGLDVLPVDQSYEGSAFFVAHSDVKGDVKSLYTRTQGLWRLDGDLGTASVEMDGVGGITTYYGSGSVENTGYLEYVEDGHYEAYDDNGALMMTIVFESDTQFFDDGNGFVYIKTES